MAPCDGNEDRRLARRALNLADQLLGDLEDVQLRGGTAVPSWCWESTTALHRAAIEAGIRDPHLKGYSGVIGLVDDVFTLEERLMRRLRLRTGQRALASVSA